MLTINDSYPDLVIPAYFRVKESAGEWRIIHVDYESAIDSLLDEGHGTANSETACPDGANGTRRVQGRGDYPVARIKSSTGKESEVIVRVYRRGGLAGLVLPDIFNDARRPLNELVLTEKGRAGGVPLPEILGLQIKWVLPFFYRAKIVVKKIPDAVTLEETIFSLAKENEHRQDSFMLSQKCHCEERSDEAILPVRETEIAPLPSIARNDRMGPVLYLKKINLIASLVKAIRQLHNAGMNHRDLNIRNILIKQSGIDFTAYIIDLDKSAYELSKTGLSLDKRIDNLIRLNRSLDKMLFKTGSSLKVVISHTDRLRLFELYFQGEGSNRAQKQVIINKCLQQAGLHKWWWKLIYPRLFI
ncbi:MAG: lipopolysaccharide kinase InaA family protein [Planctomycetota bacterium]